MKTFVAGLIIGLILGSVGLAITKDPLTGEWCIGTMAQCGSDAFPSLP